MTTETFSRNHRGVDLVSDALPFGRLWYTKPDDAVDYAKFRSRSTDAVIHVYDAAGNVIERQLARPRVFPPLDAKLVHKRRNLWLAIIGHGLFDASRFVLFYFQGPPTG
jgi:hypothetical protein